MRLFRILGLLVGFGLIAFSVGCGLETVSSRALLPNDSQTLIIKSGETVKEIDVLSRSQYFPFALARRTPQSPKEPYTHVLFLKCDNSSETAETCYKKLAERPTPRIMLELKTPTANLQASSYEFTSKLMVVFQSINPKNPYFCKPLTDWEFTTDNVGALPQVRKQNPPVQGTHTTATKLVNGVTWQCNI